MEYLGTNRTISLAVLRFRRHSVNGWALSSRGSSSPMSATYRREYGTLTETRTHRGLFTLATLALLIAVAVGLWISYSQTNPWSEQPPCMGDIDQRDTRDSRANKSDASANKQSNSVGVREERTPVESPSLPTQRGPFTLRIQVVDRRGDAVSGLQLRFADEQLWDRPKSWGVPKNMLECVTSEDGYAEIPMKRADWVYIVAVDNHWLLEAAIDAKPGKDPVLVATAVATVYFSVMIDTGQPWYGKADVTALSDKRRLPLRVKEGETAKLERVSVDDLELYFYACVIGVESQQHIVAASAIEDGATINITLKSDPNSTAGAIEVDTSGYTGTPEKLWITWGDSDVGTGGETGSLLRDLLRENPVWRSRPLRPGKHTVRITGKQKDDSVWSDVVTVEPRKITRVVVTMAALCTVQVSIMDDQSQPIPKAVFLLGDDRLPSFAFLREAPGCVACADADGNATISGLRPGPQAFTVTAEGYEPQVLEIELAEGELRVLDTVFLKKATGKITVTLTGMKDKQKYSVMLLKPGGGMPFRTLKNIETDTVTFADLPMHSYLVTIIVGKGGKPATATVELTTEQPDGAVTIDVSELVEKPLD
jgi:hypothetical protein